MTKPGYTQILVPKELHAILRERASRAKMSIAGYIRTTLEEASKPRVLIRPVEPDARVQSAGLRESLDGGLSFSGCSTSIEG
jgi:hypothetical protein